LPRRRRLARNLGALLSTTHAQFCLVMSPDGGHLYLTSHRRLADKPLEGARSTRESIAHLDELGDTSHV
jgi:hypothetical protein